MKEKTTEKTKGSALYELVVIYPISENEIGAEKQITEKCKKRGFSVDSVDKWGVKNLAYEIKKQVRGYYLRLNLSGEPTMAKELERDMQMDDKMLRYLLIRN